MRTSKKKYSKGGLLAPNGKQSNLTPEQYKLVRTPEFKDWFGDWENDPENASKVVDENGEPLVVWHGTNAYDYFNTTDKNKKVFLDPKKSTYEPRTIGGGVYFTSNESVARTYSEYDYVLECFIVIKNPKVIEGKNKDLHYVIEEKIPYGKNDGIIIKNTYDVIGGYVGDDYYLSDIFIVKTSTQIKLADGTNTTFDKKSDDIRYKKGGVVKSNEKVGWTIFGVIVGIISLGSIKTK